MKVKDLIEELKKCDPEAIVSGLYYIDQLPGYYDGAYQYPIIENHQIKEYVISRTGTKVCLIRTSLEDVLTDNPELPVRLEGFVEGNWHHQEYLNEIEKYRKEGRELQKELEEWDKNRKKND